MAGQNHLSMRVNDETMEILRAAEGRNLTDKFERMVSVMYHELPAARAEMERLREGCRQKRQELAQLRALEMERGAVSLALGDVMRKLRALDDSLDQMEGR